MVPKTKKIKRSLFKEIFLLGKKENTKFFNIKTKSSDQKKFSVVVSKKIYKKAVDRNKLKRLFFNTIKENTDKIKGGESIFIAQKSIKNTEPGEIKKDILEHLNK